MIYTVILGVILLLAAVIVLCLSFLGILYLIQESKYWFIDKEPKGIHEGFDKTSIIIARRPVSLPLELANRTNSGKLIHEVEGKDHAI